MPTVSFEGLYEQYKNLVYNLALHYVQNTEDAEEITQDVFVSIHQKWDSFRQESQVSTWIYRITINKSLDFLKARNRKKRMGKWVSLFFGDTLTVKHEQPAFNHPGVQLENKEAMERLFRCIDQLPDQQKTALLLSKTEQKTQAEMAEIMGISTKAVESLLQRAKQNLAKFLKESEG